MTKTTGTRRQLARISLNAVFSASLINHYSILFTNQYL
ncbi:hypothetical protein Q7O_002817 [Pectobacterium carotovorum subsp. carotovorum PCCS1]|nr:hypothetical protein [Pectobacterium carotovorum subsp. carotovorum PCCS1]